MQSLDAEIKPSFFDDTGSSDDFKFWKPVPTISKRFSDIRHIEGILFKRSKRTNFWKSRYFVLFEDRLAYFKNGREKTETAYCNLQNMRLELVNSSENEREEKFGVKFIHNRRHLELYARSQEVQEKWFGKLKQYCVLTSYTKQYANIKLIGEGSFAKVYLTKRLSDGAELAAKTFDKKLLTSVEKAKASLINEINIMRKLHHESVIRLHEVHENESFVYLVLELLHGGELFERIVKKGIYTEKDAAVLMKKLLSALDYMHAKGIMHRDIKPENLILKDMKNNFDVKIADFGLATVVVQSEYLFKRCGTPGYVAPEILADQKYDQKVDVFSAGVILYILLTGGSPFHGRSYNEILIKNKNCDIRFSLKDAGHGISDYAIDLLRKMLHKDPKVRISAKDCLAHCWIANGGTVVNLPEHQPEKPQLTMLSSAQENMRRFQEEHRFNVKKIKPKDLDQGNAIERSLHCPSPIINGRLTTVIDSKKRSALIPVSEQTTVDETDEDLGQTDEQDGTSINLMSRYNNNFNLLTKVKEGANSTNSSINTPVMKSQPKKQDQTFRNRVRNIQGNLMNFIRPSEDTPKQGPTITSYYEEKPKKVADVRNVLKKFE